MQLIQSRPQWQRALIFFVGMGLIVLFFIGLTLFLVVYTARNTPRNQPLSFDDDQVTVTEFAALPDDDAYPAAITLDRSDGTVVTGSFATGALWRISPQGTVTEVAGVRDAVGSISGLDSAADGTVYILDLIEPLQPSGAIVWRLGTDDTLSQVKQFDTSEDAGVQLPNDIAVDGSGNLYISDYGYDRIWRVATDGSTTVWWRADDTAANASTSTAADDSDDVSSDATAASHATTQIRNAPTGLAYDAASDALIISDPSRALFYSVPAGAADPRAETRIVFDGGDSNQNPGFDGVDVAPDGTIYFAALGINRVAEIAPGNSEPRYLAGNFRGSSDVVYDAQRNRLYITNWDQRSLLPVDVVGVPVSIDPHLPFAIEMLEFGDTTQP